MKTCSEASKLLLVCERKDPLYKGRTFLSGKRKRTKIMLLQVILIMYRKLFHKRSHSLEVMQDISPVNRGGHSPEYC